MLNFELNKCYSFVLCSINQNFNILMLFQIYFAQEAFEQQGLHFDFQPTPQLALCTYENPGGTQNHCTDH